AARHQLEANICGLAGPPSTYGYPRTATGIHGRPDSREPAPSLGGLGKRRGWEIVRVCSACTCSRTVSVRRWARRFRIDVVASSCPAGFRSWVAEIGAVPRQQLGDAVDGVGRDPLEDVAEIGFGLDAVEPSGRDQGGDRRSARTTRIGSGEQPVLPPKGDGPDRALDRIVVDFNGAVIDVARQGGPALDDVMNGCGEIAASGDAPQCRLEPNLHVGKQRFGPG